MMDRYQSRVTTMNTADHSRLRPDQRLACRRLALEIFRGYDQQFLNAKSPPVVRQKAYRRLQAALPSLTEFLNDHLLDPDDRDYVRDLLKRLIAGSASAGGGN